MTAPYSKVYKTPTILLQQASFLCELLEKNSVEIGLDDYSHEQAFEKASELTKGKYSRCLALLYNNKYSELKVFLRELEIIN